MAPYQRWRKVCAIPGPQMRGTGGTQLFVVSYSYEIRFRGIPP